LTPENEMQIRQFLSEITAPFDHQVSLTYHIVPEGKSIVYFEGPRQFVALSSIETPVEQAKLGYLGEQLILYSESIGVRTCWMGHFRTKDVHDIVLADSTPQGDHRLFCIILIGYVPEKTGFLDRFSTKRMSKKNKHLDSFLHDKSLHDFPDFIRSSLELASKAPSAMNSQKWYYLVEKTENGYSIELSKPRGYQHFKWKHYDIDVGTAAAHLWLGLKSKGKDTEVSVIERDGDAVWRFTCE
jgi:nitroreductase